ncbi:PH domain-containing protein [Halobacillus locisalis]|uniref:PH domain-containing protein n=1 Tax=Halobacillus locisalis TaxID=220753 RepID=A0A838CRU4_9BACI|nr:PH domain-containing protein [Halobacillus locisalis]MBA2174664.1 PH domain-containing protein [Halobacillus locisalis]
MMEEPARQISRRALTLWRIYGMIQFAITFVVSAALIVAIVRWEWPIWIMWVAAAILVLELIFSVWLLPSLKWKRWRYEVTEQDVELQHGILLITKTLVPMVRVQHVDTEQGPLLRKFRLATISISTAATVHKIPALDEQEAEELRQSISALARVAEDDV